MKSILLYVLLLTIVVPAQQATTPDNTNLVAIVILSSKDKSAIEKKAEKIKNLPELSTFIAECKLGEKGIYYRLCTGNYNSKLEANKDLGKVRRIAKSTDAWVVELNTASKDVTLITKPEAKNVVTPSATQKTEKPIVETKIETHPSTDFGNQFPEPEESTDTASAVPVIEVNKEIEVHSDSVTVPLETKVIENELKPEVTKVDSADIEKPLVKTEDTSRVKIETTPKQEVEQPVKIVEASKPEIELPKTKDYFYDWYNLIDGTDFKLGYKYIDRKQSNFGVSTSLFLKRYGFDFGFTRVLNSFTEISIKPSFMIFNYVRDRWKVADKSDTTFFETSRLALNVFASVSNIRIDPDNYLVNQGSNAKGSSLWNTDPRETNYGLGVDMYASYAIFYPRVFIHLQPSYYYTTKGHPVSGFGEVGIDIYKFSLGAGYYYSRGYNYLLVGKNTPKIFFSFQMHLDW